MAYHILNLMISIAVACCTPEESEVERRRPGASQLELRTQAMEAELEQEAMDDAAERFPGHREAPAAPEAVPAGGEVEALRAPTQSITERNEFMVEALGAMRLKAIMESCEQ